MLCPSWAKMVDERNCEVQRDVQVDDTLGGEETGAVGRGVDVLPLVSGGGRGKIFAVVEPAKSALRQDKSE